MYPHTELPLVRNSTSVTFVSSRSLHPTVIMFYPTVKCTLTALSILLTAMQPVSAVEIPFYDIENWGGAISWVCP